MIITIIRTIIGNWCKQRSKAPNSISNDLPDPRVALKQYFGYDDFREGQCEVIEKLLLGKNLLGAFPTAFGKSICYQLPGLMLPDLTVILSPLISLMKDQVDALQERGINSVGLLNSSLTTVEYQQELKRLADGEIKLLYVSPERFRSRRFLNTLKVHEVSLFVVDEAHCISQWGHDFRPDYLALRNAIQAVNPDSVALFTATATPEVRQDIVNQLQVEKCETIIQSVERPNLKFSVCEVPGEPEKYQLLTKQLEQLTGKGIVYAGTRRQTEEIAKYLKSKGYRVDFYHGTREESERTRVQDAFFDDTAAGIEIVVATNAFGMGRHPVCYSLEHRRFTRTLLSGSRTCRTRWPGFTVYPVLLFGRPAFAGIFYRGERTEQSKPPKIAKANRGLAIGQQVPAGQSRRDGICK